MYSNLKSCQRKNFDENITMKYTFIDKNNLIRTLLIEEQIYLCQLVKAYY